jgi:NADPH-dependent F420 reductase
MKGTRIIMLEDGTTIAVIGGTGREGSGLGLRWAAAGLDVVIGSRKSEKARRVADELNAQLEGETIRGLANRDAAAVGDVIILSVPYAAHRAILEDIRPALAGKLLVDVTAPLDPNDKGRVRRGEPLSPAVAAQEFVGDATPVVAAFQNISAVHLKNLEHEIDSDVLVCGDDADAKHTVMELAARAGMRGLDAGPLVNATVIDGLAAVLIALNRNYGTRSAGIRITGLPDADVSG